MSAAAVSLSDRGSSHADTITVTPPSTWERKVEVQDTVGIEQVEKIKPRVRTGVDFDDYFVSPP